MSKVGDFFTWIILSLILLWVSGMIFAGDKCTRVYRSAWPAVYTIGAAEAVSQNWTSIETKLLLLQWKAKSVVAIQSAFEMTAYGGSSACKK